MSEDNPHGFLDFLFGAAPLKKAAGTKAAPTPPQDTTYIKKKIDEYMAQKMAKEAAAAKPAPKAAMEELSKPRPKKKPMGGDAGQQRYGDKDEE